MKRRAYQPDQRAQRLVESLVGTHFPVILKSPTMDLARSCLFLAVAAASVPLVSLGCSSGSDEPYKPAPAWSGRKAAIPAVPTLPTNPIKVGDSYSIFGAIHHLHSRIHNVDVTAKDISITGYIVDSNIPTAPKCAVHKTGKKDPDDCVDIPIPSFWIADAKGDPKDPKLQKIRVLGWAKNFATIFDAMDAYKGKDAASCPTDPKKIVKDDVWSVDVPCPLPAVGAKVKVTGKYGYTFTKATSGIVSDPNTGVMTYGKVDQLEAAPEPAAFAKK
jgi:hypothetical protein